MYGSQDKQLSVCFLQLEVTRVGFCVRYGRIAYSLQFNMSQGGVSTAVSPLYRTFHTRGSEHIVNKPWGVADCGLEIGDCGLGSPSLVPNG